MKILEATKSFSIAALFAVVFFAVSGTAQAQGVDTRIPDVHYIVRDSKGKIIDMSAPDAPRMRDANGNWVAPETFTFEFNLEATGRVKATALTSKGYKGRTKLDEITLKHRGKVMRLIFDLSVPTIGPSFEVDSLPFQQGTFKLDTSLRENRRMSDWPFFPAKAWKKISSKP